MIRKVMLRPCRRDSEDCSEHCIYSKEKEVDI